MKKVVITGVLLVIIAVTTLFSFLYVTLNLIDPSNSINQTVRKRILFYSPLRKLLRLQQVGDARYEYMYKRTLPLEVFLYYQDGVSLEEKTRTTIAGQMQFATHKTRPVLIHDPEKLIGVPDKVTEEDINALLDRYEDPFTLFEDSVPLRIFVLRYYLPRSSYAGLVTDAHSMFLFKDAITNVAESPSSLIAVEISTILHEFAHLGGAEHILNHECILADKVENLDFFNKITTIRDSYCKEDVDAISKALEF